MISNTYITQTKNGTIEWERSYTGEYVVYVTLINGDKMRYHTTNYDNAKAYYKKLYRSIGYKQDE